jgi:coat protein Gp5
MAFSEFIPEVWNAEMLLNFHEQVIAAALANRQYEGDLARGNTVHISTAVDVAVKDYKANSRQTSPDSVDLTQLDLVIDQEKSFDFLIDDIDRVQAAGSMSAYTQSASIAMAEDSDQFLLAQWVGAATEVETTLSTPTDGDAAFGIVRDLRKHLNKNHIPKSSRYLLCNAEFEGILLDASSKLTNVNTSGDSTALRNGTLGGLLGFQIVATENLPTVNLPQALAVYAPAVAYVSQIEQTEAMRDIDSFSDRMRGLHVYGGKVIRPTGLAVFTATS